jgi:RNA polymerase sigma-70 factor (ECF subfamily)
MAFSEDSQTVERILAGDPEAFEILVRRYNRLGGAVAYAIVGDFHQAEDIVQEAFLKAFRALGTLRQPDRFKNWFVGLVRSRALDVLRERRAHRVVAVAEVPEDAGSAAQPSPEDVQVLEEGRRRIRETVDELEETDRLVVVLKHMEGLSYKEIAELLETTESAVESRLFRARQVLRKKLSAGRP